MKCQSVFSGKIRKNILKGCLLKFLLSMQSINKQSVPSCSKLRTSLVNDSLKFTLIRKYADTFC